MFPAYILSFATGFLSLSLEILWVRIFGFVNLAIPQAFAFVLGLYLIGIAMGARIGKKICDRPANLWEISGFILLISSFIDLASPWIYAELAHTSLQMTVGGSLILLTALLKAILFPIAHHLGVPANSNKIGTSISKVYVSNIIGSTLGPIVTGFVLLDFFSTQSCFAICAGLTLVIGLFCFKNEAKQSVLKFTALFSMLILAYAVTRPSNSLILKLAYPGGEIRKIVENRHGVVTIYHGGKEGDKVFGSNVYDGRTNLDPVINSNGINRILILAALQKNPEHVLMVGLSIGSWLALINSFPGVKQVDVIEINPGYLTAIKDYPLQQRALLDPRIKLYIDDGRRWLRAHPKNKYDLIIMNTTFYWRAYSSNLLSKDFLELITMHMKSRAVFAYNSTGCPDALKTAATVFPHAYLYENFVIAADFDWRKKLSDPQALSTVMNLRLYGNLLFKKENKSLVQKFLNNPIMSIDALVARYQQQGRRLEVITDYNLRSEYGRY